MTIPKIKLLMNGVYFGNVCFLQVKDQINCEFRMHELVERSVNCAERLMALYEDKDGYDHHLLAKLASFNKDPP